VAPLAFVDSGESLYLMKESLARPKVMAV